MGWRPAVARTERSLPWLAAFALALGVPLLPLLPQLAPPGRGFWWDFSMSVGFGALALFGTLFALTARFRRATLPFGIDVVYWFHRYLAIGAVGLAIAHYAIVRLMYPAALGAADPRIAPAAMTAGRIGLALLVLVIALSLLRRALRHDYDRWRRLHALMATAGFALALAH
ncbi:MAG TPA: ferric reductase-like transmembrane domain-containing protein, partial [Burkholderiaceae bacterium]|nr:ferric reductase-like transmembrane domain-containing protein [Burkholderiaceae bacterium]